MKDSILKLLQERYFLKDEKEWDDIAKRCSNILPEMYDYIKSMDYIPSSPTLMNIGTERGTLSSCFPLQLEDSIIGIFNALRDGAIVTKNSGGCGWDFSVLRSSEENIKTLDADSSGPLAFIESFNTMLDCIRQGGKRRGAGGALLNGDHPDIIKYIKIKQKIDKLVRFNLSVALDDNFYNKLELTPDSPHIVYNVVDKKEKELLDNGKVVSVRQLWDMIVDAAWTTAEPGIFNKDIAFNRCAVTNINKQVLINPCFEFVNIPYTSCCLGSINLSNLVEHKKFNWEKFESIIVTATQYMNKIIDINKYPLEQIKEVTLKTRPIGIGFMGLADALYKKEVAYNSEKALKFTEEMTRYLTLRSMQESVEIAKIEGVYEAFDYDLFMKVNDRFFTKNCRNIDIEKLKKDIKKYGVRNSCFTSIAPTGTISFLADTTGGMEPCFALSFIRKIEKQNKEYEEVFVANVVFEEYLTRNFLEEEKKKILKIVANNKGSCQTCEDIPQEIRKIFIVAGDLTPIEHLDMLEKIANNVSLSVSKTINLLQDVSKEEISYVFLQAHKRGIIGVTVYRENSRQGILVHSSSIEKRENKIQHCGAPKRPKTLPCHVYKINTVNRTTKETEKWVVFVGMIDEEPYEIFAGKINLIDLPSNITEGVMTRATKGIYQFSYNGEVIVKDVSKIFESGTEEALTRLISAGLRHGIEIEFLISQLSKSYGTVADFNKAITRSLKKYIKDKETGQICEKCGNKLSYIEGCISCTSCGNSKCG